MEAKSTMNFVFAIDESFGYHDSLISQKRESKAHTAEADVHCVLYFALG